MALKFPISPTPSYVYEEELLHHILISRLLRITGCGFNPKQPLRCVLSGWMERVMGMPLRVFKFFFKRGF